MREKQQLVQAAMRVLRADFAVGTLFHAPPGNLHHVRTPKTFTHELCMLSTAQPASQGLVKYTQVWQTPSTTHDAEVLVSLCIAA